MKSYADGLDVILPAPDAMRGAILSLPLCNSDALFACVTLDARLFRSLPSSCVNHLQRNS
jgi:hypothetical protein